MPKPKKLVAPEDRLYYCREHDCHVSDCFATHNPNAYPKKKRTRKKKEQIRMGELD